MHRAIEATLLGLGVIGLGEWSDLYRDPLSPAFDPTRPAAALMPFWSVLPMLLVSGLLLLRALARRWVALAVAPDVAAHAAAWSAATAGTAAAEGFRRAEAAVAALNSSSSAGRRGLARQLPAPMPGGPWSWRCLRAAMPGAAGCSAAVSMEQLFAQAGVVQVFPPSFFCGACSQFAEPGQ